MLITRDRDSKSIDLRILRDMPARHQLVYAIDEARSTVGQLFDLRHANAPVPYSIAKTVCHGQVSSETYALHALAAGGLPNEWSLWVTATYYLAISGLGHPLFMVVSHLSSLAIVGRLTLHPALYSERENAQACSIQCVWPEWRSAEQQGRSVGGDPESKPCCHDPLGVGLPALFDGELDSLSAVSSQSAEATSAGTAQAIAQTRCIDQSAVGDHQADDLGVDDYGQYGVPTWRTLPGSG